MCIYIWYFFNYRLGLKWRQRWRIKGFSNEESRTIKYTFSHMNIEQFVLLINENLVVNKLRYSLERLEDFRSRGRTVIHICIDFLQKRKSLGTRYELYAGGSNIPHRNYERSWWAISSFCQRLTVSFFQKWRQVWGDNSFIQTRIYKILNETIFKTLMAIFYKDRIGKLAHRYGKYLNIHSDFSKGNFFLLDCCLWCFFVLHRFFSLYPKWKKKYIYPLCIY